MVLLGADVGGTFTDCVLVDPRTGELRSTKVSTTPDDPSRGALAGLLSLLAEASVKPGHVTRVVHGTTVGTNAVLTRRGPRVALLSNAGFEDVLEIARQDRPALYDPEATRPEPLVPRASRYGIRGRLDHRGHEIEPLDDAAIQRIAPQLRTHDAVAIVLLHAYANPDHETRAAEQMRKHAPGLPVITSHETVPEFREYERTSTTVVNAYLTPVVDRYLDRLARGLADAGIRAPLFILESTGGILTPQAARKRPVATVLSGPAGGAAAVGLLARLTGEANLLGLDIGGTSTDLSVVTGGRIQEAQGGEIGGFPIRVPMLDIATLGAGGGSLARVDAGGMLRVGPESAGAVPGPACYGRGGTEPTVTDAHIVLGHLGDTLGGRYPMDAKAAAVAIGRLADALGTDPDRAAQAVLAVADAGIVGAARQAIARRGLDPRDFTLCAFGGAGPMHATTLARQLGQSRVLVPASAGVLSALGMLTTPLRRDAVRTWLRGALADAAAALQSLAAETARALQAEAAAAKVTLRLACDARYRGQSHELVLPLATPGDVADAPARFHKAHQAAYGYADPDRLVEVVALRAVAEAALDSSPRLPVISKGGSEPAPVARTGTRDALLGPVRTRATVWNRTRLHAGNRLEGPAIVEDPGATTLLPPGTAATVDAHGTLVLEVRP